MRPPKRGGAGKKPAGGVPLPKMARIAAPAPAAGGQLLPPVTPMRGGAPVGKAGKHPAGKLGTFGSDRGSFSFRKPRI